MIETEKDIRPMADQAYDCLYHKIMLCEYLPGQELKEKFLLEDTGFGRTPLREALLLLQREKMVAIFPRKGMQITPITEKSAKDLYQTRKLIEPTVVEEYKTLYSKGKLLQYQQKFHQTVHAQDLDRFLLDVDFHSYLISITENEVLMEMYKKLMVTQVRLAMYASLKNCVSSREDRSEERL